MRTFDELMNDLRIVKDATTKSEKIPFVEKYNSPSYKAKDIIECILKEMRDERSSRKTYSEDDLKAFSYDDRPFKIKISEECYDFVKYYKDTLYDEILKKKLLNKMHLANTRDWNFSMSAADKYIISKYKDTLKVLANFENVEMNVESEISEMCNQLLGKSEEFHKTYIEIEKKNAETFFDLLPKSIEKLNSKISSFGTDLDYNEILEKNRLTFRKKFLESILERGKEIYVEEKLDSAEIDYVNNMKYCAERMYNAGIRSGFVLKHIDFSVKGFEMTISYENRTWFARGIIAAEYSEKVSTHIRYIITER